MSDDLVQQDVLPPGYGEWLDEMKNRIYSAQMRAALSVNTEMLQMYWQIGQGILDRQADQGWG